MSKKNVIKKSALTPTVLVAGGAGFIGSHLCEALLDKGARVVVLDNFNTGKEIHIDHLLNNKSFAIFNVDINKGIPKEIESVDYVFHFAGLEEYLYNKNLVSLDSLLTNSFGTKNLLDLAARSEAKFLLASSIDVYEGRMSQLDLDQYFGKTTFEENKYGMTEAKRFAEALVWEYQKKVEVDVRIVRLSEVYGPRMDLDSSGSLGGLLKELLEGKDLTIIGDGSEKEYYTYIDDVTSGIIRSLFNKDTKNNIYSLVNREPYSVLEIAFLVKNIADRQLEVKSVEGVKEPVPTPKTPDTSNLGMLGWEPKISLKDGVKKTLEWMGYSFNEHSFKPAKLIEGKAEKGDKSSEEKGLFSLSDVKDSETASTGSGSAAADNEEVLKENYKKVGEGFEQTYEEKAQVLSIESKHEEPGRKFKFPDLGKKINLGFIGGVLKIFAKPHVAILLGIILPTVLIFLLHPLYGFYSNARESIYAFQNITKDVSKLNSTNLAIESERAYDSIVKARESLDRMKWMIDLVGKSEEYRTLDKMLSSLESFSRAGTYISSAVLPYESLGQVIKPDSSYEIDEQSFNEARLAINSAQDYLDLAEADYGDVNKDLIPEKLRQLTPKYEKYLALGHEGLDLLSDINESLPSLLGRSEPKRYMILFQNSNEIRPTGGFIGSYGVIEFDKGKIKDLIIDDIYNPDGQIEIRDIQNEPPGPVQELLDEDRLYIRNANWDPRFPESAKKIEELYEEVTDTQVDGVIAIDLEFVRSLLEVTGPIFLTSYNEEITSENLYERTQYHSEFNYDDGSDQKKSFLTFLGSKLLERMFDFKKDDIPELADQLRYSLEGRHLMIYLEDSPLYTLIGEKRWDGSLIKAEGDYLQIVNANLGGTKANYYVQNTYDYKVMSKTRDGLLRAELTMKYNHTGEDESWPGGPYTNYVRVLTQAGTKLTGAEIRVADLESQDVFENIVVDQVGEYVSYEYFFTVNPQEEAILVLKYDLPEDLVITKESSYYDLNWQKQAGVSGDAYSVSVSPPFGMGVSEMSPSFELNGDQIFTSGTMEKDFWGFIRLR